MYRNCIFCAGDLKANEALERFPVGRTVAFDAEKGRLWAVCPRCARWNLAPLEERWEPVEDAERLFRDTRMRVQNENIGLARLPDGTRLIRVGQALPGELALWRYGRKLQRRRTTYLAAMGIGAGVGVGVPIAAVGSAATGFTGGAAAFLVLAHALSLWGQWRPRLQSRSLLPYTGLQVDAEILRTVRLAHTLDGRVSVELPLRAGDVPPGMGIWSHGMLLLSPDYGRTLLRRGMVELNAAGAGAGRVRTAVDLLTARGSADAFLHDAAARGAPLEDPLLDRSARTAHLLAVEMAVHEELEREALEGELAALEAAWREAEEIAGIADALPDAGDPADAEPALGWAAADRALLEGREDPAR